MLKFTFFLTEGRMKERQNYFNRNESMYSIKMLYTEQCLAAAIGHIVTVGIFEIECL